jgi:hypothetical protein
MRLPLAHLRSKGKGECAAEGVSTSAKGWPGLAFQKGDPGLSVSALLRGRRFGILDLRGEA